MGESRGFEVGAAVGAADATGVSVGAAVGVGVGVAGHHHGEILQGAVRLARAGAGAGFDAGADADAPACAATGEVTACLITMPARGVGSTARYVREGGETLEVSPAWKTKAGRAARLALAHLGEKPFGCLEVSCTVATGVGLGSSTCDVVAAIRAVCNAFGAQLDGAQVARIAIEAEGAADPIMFENEVVLFAQRRGQVLESFGEWIPRYTVLSVDTDVGTAGIDTLSLPAPAYTDAELSAFEVLIARAREAFRARDSVAIAAIATQSATLNQRFVPLRCFHEIYLLASDMRALGVQISHSGTVAGILFEPERVDPARVGSAGALLHRAAAQLAAMGLRTLGQFTTGSGELPR